MPLVLETNPTSLAQIPIVTAGFTCPPLKGPLKMIATNSDVATKMSGMFAYTLLLTPKVSSAIPIASNIMIVLAGGVGIQNDSLPVRRIVGPGVIYRRFSSSLLIQNLYIQYPIFVWLKIRKRTIEQSKYSNCMAQISLCLCSSVNFKLIVEFNLINLRMGKYLLKICERQLNLRNTLINGQCFNWTKVSDNLYSGVIFQQYLEVSRQDPHTVCVQVYPDKIKNFEKVLEKYFNIEINLQKLQNKWCVGNQHLKGICEKIPGIRILQQDPWECTISFICSQNNNISRITKLLFSLREKYGKFIIEKHNQKHYAFPTLEDLKEAKAQHLRDMGFGYRAQFLIQAIAKVNSHGGSQWLNDLRGQKHQTVRNQLIGFKGVGRKVADCISLFSMDCHSSVPVDTHIFQIAKKLGYIKQNTDKKSLSDTLYKRISDCYVQKYGEYAGWAQQILFAGDLVMFKDKLKQPKEPLVDDTQIQEQEVKPIRRKR